MRKDDFLRAVAAAGLLYLHYSVYPADTNKVFMIMFLLLILLTSAVFVWN